jgi:hypothetical protein
MGEQVMRGFAMWIISAKMKLARRPGKNPSRILR